MRIAICRANPLAPDPRVDKISRALAQGGHTVTQIGWDMAGDYPPLEKSSGLKILRLDVPAEFGRGLSNIRHQIRWQWALAKWLACHHAHYDAIHACDFDTILPALLCKRLWGVKVVYDIFDFYADMLRATPEWVKSLIRRVDISAINSADALILADEARQRQIQGAVPRRLTVIYNCLEDRRDSLPPLHRPGFVPGSLHLVYVGNIQVERGLLVLLEVLRLHPEWTLDLAGFGGDEAHIVGIAKALPNVAWHGRVAYEYALQLSRSADLFIATYDPKIPNNRYASPNKVFEAMMLAKPILVARDTLMDRLIEQAECGLVVEYGDWRALENALLRLQEQPEQRLRLGNNARRAFEATYNWANMQARLLALYQELANQ